jgi:hypothetical protein
MNIYEYIATSNPQVAQGLISRYGYQAQAETTQDLGDCLEQLVAQEGEPAMRDIAAIHPDKDLILEEFGSGMTVNGSGQLSSDCGCAKCRGAGKVSESYIHAAAKDQNFFHMNQAGMFIIGGLIVVTLAIISTKS